MGRPPSCECGECAKCKHRIYMREWYRRRSTDQRRELVEARDKEKVRAADRARYERDKAKRRAAMDAYARANPEKVAAHKRSWAERNPEKRAAHIALGNAIRSGKVTREPCEKCGGVKVHGHHDDYSKPLEVRWLCPKHHAEERRKH